MHFVNAKSLVTSTRSMNLYRGCTHGCIYCDSRSDCYRFAHDYEDIEVKQNAPELLERTLCSSRKKFMISTGSMCDPYQPCEKELKLTRRCLELILQYGFGASVITKSDLILRDLDLFEEISSKSKAVVQMTITVADEELSRKIEPNVCTSKRRYEVLKEFQKYGVPAVVWLSPVLPMITDTEENIRQILEWCFDAGVKGIIMYGAAMTLRSGCREYYYNELDRMFPGLSRKYERMYGDSYLVVSTRHEKLMKIFHEECEKHGVLHTPEDCFRFINEMPERYRQLNLFDD